jgi:putative hydrolase of the HAD superfamily
MIGSTSTPDKIQDAFARQFRHSGPVTTDNEKRWWKDVVHRVFLDVGMVENFDRFFEEVYDQFRDSRGWRLFPETRGVLEAFKRHGMKVGAVSNFDSRLYSVMKDLEILTYFDTVTISSETGYAKPGPEIFLAAVEALGAPPDRILFAGDSLTDDFQAAQAVGLEAFLLDRPRRYVQMRSVRRIESLEELLGLAGIPKGY